MFERISPYLAWTRMDDRKSMNILQVSSPAAWVSSPPSLPQPLLDLTEMRVVHTDRGNLRELQKSNVFIMVDRPH